MFALISSGLKLDRDIL